MEKRFVGLERDVINLGRRISDNENSINAVLAWKASIEESTEVNKEMVEVGKAILKALGWVNAAARWIIAIGGAVAVVWTAVKAVAAIKIIG